jgi:hypothetical protein
VLFVDVAVWNIAIQNSSATQASLFVNLVCSGWVLSPTYSLTRNQQLIFGLERQWHYLEWLCWSVLNFSLELDTAFLLAVLAGVLYSIYLLMSKSTFSDGRTLFHDNQHPFINGIFRYCLYPT